MGWRAVWVGGVGAYVDSPPHDETPYNDFPTALSHSAAGTEAVVVSPHIAPGARGSPNIV